VSVQRIFGFALPECGAIEHPPLRSCWCRPNLSCFPGVTTLQLAFVTSSKVKTLIMSNQICRRKFLSITAAGATRSIS